MTLRTSSPLLVAPTLPLQLVRAANRIRYDQGVFLEDIAILRSMSFLDNLESNLKALESREERDPKALAREAAVREAARSAALQIAPHADALRNGPFLNGLLTACRDIGHPRRILVRAVG